MTVPQLRSKEEEAPNGCVIQAGNGRFSCAAVFNNQDVELGSEVSYEDLLEHKDELLDMSQATQGWTWMQKILAERKKKS